MNAGNDMRRVGDALVDSVRENPVGAALLGMGLVWLISSRTGAPEIAGRALQSTGDALGSAASTVGDAARRAGATVSDFGASAGAAIRDKADAAYETLRDAGDDATDRARDMVKDVTSKASDFERAAVQEWSDIGAGRTTSGQIGAARQWLSRHLTDQPLLLAAGALAVGAAIAATLPATQAEAQAFGKPARDAVDAAADAARKGFAKAVDRADDVVRAAGDEAKRQGLTPDALVQKASELGDKARDVLGEAADALKGAAPKSTQGTTLL